MKVTLVDYGAGNVTSVERALQRLGAESIRATTAECVQQAEALLLPGVGHFGALVRAIDERKMRAPLLDAIECGVPFLGICLGLQALYASSEEAPELAGLRVFPSQIRALPRDVKLPHMGWNQVRAAGASQLLQGIEPGAYFYFAHSYAAIAGDSESNSAVAATCSHGADFVAVLEWRNIFAVQFHPEKSGAPGARLLQNFLRLAA
jgi:imidazole glycerol phosphate synthase glutamine amidotransferase subunit